MKVQMLTIEELRSKIKSWMYANTDESNISKFEILEKIKDRPKSISPYLSMDFSHDLLPSRLTPKGW